MKVFLFICAGVLLAVTIWQFALFIRDVKINRARKKIKKEE